MRQTVKRIHRADVIICPILIQWHERFFDLLTLVSYNGKKSKTETSLNKT